MILCLVERVKDGDDYRTLSPRHIVEIPVETENDAIAIFNEMAMQSVATSAVKLDCDFDLYNGDRCVGSLTEVK